MPLQKGKSQKAFNHNVEAEMKSGKSQDQSLAIAYSVKRKKKMASGGTVESGSKDMNYADGGKVISASNEERPSTQTMGNDRHEIARQGATKALKDSQWDSRSDIKQSQGSGMKVTRVKHPKMVGSDVLQARLRDEEDDLQTSAGTNEGKQQQPRKVMDEEDATKSGNKVNQEDGRHISTRIEEQKVDNLGRHLRSIASPSEDEGESDAQSKMEKGANRKGVDTKDLHMKMMAKGGEVKDEETKDEETKGGTGGAKTSTTGNKTKTGGSNPGGASTGGAGTVTITTRDLGSKGINVSNVGGKTDSANSGGMDPSDEEDEMMMAEGGEVDSEADEERHNSIAAAIMAKKDRLQSHMDSGSRDMDEMVRMFEGGEITQHSGSYNGEDSLETHEDEDQADLSRNAEEDANMEDQSSYDAMRKENYSESEGLSKMSQPTDSNETGDEREDAESDDHDMVSQIRRKMKSRRQMPQE